ncbi:MAG: hypothetical protein HY303_18075 [Candidatus Wallbacteria bacterium]|nr:hypothetical protein [Candidatus Wallbacteria bacterium]
MGKRHRKPPSSGPRVWITLGLIAMGVAGIVMLNAEFARQNAESDTCHTALKQIAEAVKRAPPLLGLANADPKDIQGILERSGALPGLPAHRGTGSPYVFAKGGAVYCREHGAPKD